MPRLPSAEISITRNGPTFQASAFGMAGKEYDRLDSAIEDLTRGLFQQRHAFSLLPVGFLTPEALELKNKLIDFLGPEKR